MQTILWPRLQKIDFFWADYSVHYVPIILNGSYMLILEEMWQMKREK